MITEFIIAGAGLATYRACENYYKNNHWKKYLREDVMVFNEVCNFKEEPFILIDGERTKYGTKLIVSLKNKTLKKVEEMKEQLEIYYKTDVEIEQNKNKCTATIDIYKNKLDDHTKYEPKELEPYELYVSLNRKFELMVADMTQHTHVLVSGANGSGKSKLLQIMLTNLIFPNKRNVEIYISNKTNSPDFRDFLNCHQVKGYVDDMRGTLLLLDYIMHIFNKRLEVINSRNCDNIKHYNKKHKDKQMTYIYLFIDEFAQYFPDDKDEDEYDEKIKAKIHLKRMAEILRKTGIFLVISTQRPDANSLSPSMKCNLRTKMGFAQENQASSLVVADDSSLVGIPNREFLYMFGSERVWCKTLFLSPTMIKDFVKSSVIKNRRKQNDFNVFLRMNGECKEEVVKDKNTNDNKEEKKESKRKSKATAMKPKKDKVVEQEQPQKEAAVSEVATVSKFKNISVESINGYDVIDGKICVRVQRRIE